MLIEMPSLQSVSSPEGLIVFLFVNLITAASFYMDKRRAIAGEPRISEARLLGLALAGGTPAAYVSRSLFRHKRQKQPFSLYLHLIAAGQILFLGWLTYMA